MNNRYGTLASRVYELDKPVGTSFGDVEFYRDRLKDCSGPILEPAAGNGRILVPLLEAGLDLVGFDASDEMLGYCRKACNDRGLSADLRVQTYESFDYDKKFEAIIVPAGSIQLITDFSAFRAVLLRFREHLSPNGRLIVDLLPTGSVLAERTGIRSWVTPDDKLITLASHRVETDYLRQSTTSHDRYELWRNGRLVETELEVFSLRWWGVEEFALALRDTGFRDLIISGNHEHGRAPHKNDKVITFEAHIG